MLNTKQSTEDKYIEQDKVILERERIQEVH
jgi:hypothetical protein